MRLHTTRQAKYAHVTYADEQKSYYIRTACNKEFSPLNTCERKPLCPRCAGTIRQMIRDLERVLEEEATNE